MAALTVLFAPDSFKGALASVEVARALAEGWRRARPDDRVVLAPLADGGEGTLEAIFAAGGWEWQSCRCHDPMGREIPARWLRSADGARAIVELAEASGLSRLRDGLAPVDATTRGTGEVIRAVLESGVRQVVLGIGGSATTDGGRGLLEALGASFDGEPGRLRADLSRLDRRLADVRLRVACDVTNPLLGEHGAAATYGPQKGASAEQVRELDARLAAFADALETASGRRERTTPGAGAAGGVGFGLLCMQDRLGSFALAPGIELVMEETGFGRRLEGADLVVSGEGSVDAQTANGKTAFGVAGRAREAGVACVVVGGAVDADGAACLAELGAVAVPVVDRPLPLDEAMRESASLLAATGERLARLVEIGATAGRGVASGITR